MGEIVELTDANFEAEVLNSTGIVLVDVWAPWCVPCRMLGQTIDAIADEYADRVRVGKLNVDDAPVIASALTISAVPVVLIYLAGYEVDRTVGVATKEHFTKALDALLKDLPDGLHETPLHRADEPRA